MLPLTTQRTRIKTKKPMNNPDTIIIHHSRTKDSGTMSWSAIRKYHVTTNKWGNVGYHYGIERVGDSYETMLGRMPDVEGAHCAPHGYNRKSIGICLVGNFDEHFTPPEQISKAVELIIYLMRSYEITVDRVLGHREIDTRRTCPGGLLSMHNLRNEIKRRL